MNGDGLQDVLLGSFSGAPQWIVRTEAGLGTPAAVLDKEGDAVVVSKFWNFDTEEWDESKESGVEGQGSSVAAVDWDDDGDVDLLQGGYHNGSLFLRLNEGSATETKFATTSQVVNVDGDPLEIEGGIGTPRIVDWDGDGLFDILIGTIHGEVLLLYNAGSKGFPEFLDASALVELLPGKAGSKKIKRVLGKDGGPSAPGSSFHIEAVDYDHDGDLDLLVGARSEWLTGPIKEPTPEDFKRQEQLRKEADAAWDKFKAYRDSVTDKEEAKKLTTTEKYRTLLAEHRALSRAAFAVTEDPIERGDFIWLFRRK